MENSRKMLQQLDSSIFTMTFPLRDCEKISDDGKVLFFQFPLKLVLLEYELISISVSMKVEIIFLNNANKTKLGLIIINSNF